MRNSKFVAGHSALVLFALAFLVLVVEGKRLLNANINLGPCLLHFECSPQVNCWCCMGDPRKQCWLYKSDCLAYC
ncbi:hypothetical protein ERO13_D04G065050v2 [Gossypium hirsutum]|uniref:Embryo surrounding factor 1 brassicaceae domain-containing protein n=1 Tax=Gossypium darwinii TaxID=34276 RepID=A0A5D2CTZ7_GOSDA|nr:hypothetical protein ERO13_D04G065050v2 [Gossypium hirsutum]TYG73147.1 hypothetical protein ES288_D04G077300v1 [Gossypium darwinii]